MKHVLIILILSLTVSCTNNTENSTLKSEIDLSRTQAVKIHDELMEKMGELNSLKKELEVMAADSGYIDRNAEIELFIHSIIVADKSMWDWMHNFNVAYADENDSVTLIYFEEKKKSIEHVKVLFDSAISSANVARN